MGAYNGVDMSNTLYFESIGWTGLLVEAVPHLAAQCRLDRPRSVTINVAVVGPMDRGPVTIDVVSAAEFLSKRSEKSVAENYALPAAETSQIETIDVTGSTMDDVLSAARLASIDFMTIDVEGGEWGVLQGFTIGHWNPRFVLI
ncbi:MAG: FkbM family methyltransferase, partial [Pseudonocardiaceae bacterium]